MSSTSLWEQISGLDKKPPSLATHKIVPGRRPVVTVAVSLCQQRSPTRGSDGVPYQVAVAANLRWVWHYRVYTAKLFFFLLGVGWFKAEVQFAEDKEPDVLSKNTGDESVLNWFFSLVTERASRWMRQSHLTRRSAIQHRLLMANRFSSFLPLN